MVSELKEAGKVKPEVVYLPGGWPTHSHGLNYKQEFWQVTWPVCAIRASGTREAKKPVPFH
jgi:hypothetical protein